RLTDLQAVHARKHEAEHDEIGLVLDVRLDRLRTVERDDHPVALALESSSDRLRDRLLIIDDQHGLLAHGANRTRALWRAGCPGDGEIVMGQRSFPLVRDRSARASRCRAPSWRSRRT